MLAPASPIRVPATRPPSPHASLLGLPTEVLTQVLAELPAPDLALAGATCREVRGAALDPRLGLRRQAVLARAHDAYQAVLPERRRVPGRFAPHSVVLPERRRVLQAALNRHLGEVGPELFAQDASRWLAPGGALPGGTGFRNAFVPQLERTLVARLPNFFALASAPALLCANEILAVLNATKTVGSDAKVFAAKALRTLAERVHARLDGVDFEALRERSALLCRRTGGYPLGVTWSLCASKQQLTRYDALCADAQWHVVADVLADVLPLGDVSPALARDHALQLLAEVLGDADVAVLTQAGSVDEARRRRLVVVALFQQAWAKRIG